jgi:hypothetical protein
MGGKLIIVAGIEIPSGDPVFLAVVGVHVLLGLASTITGVIAMLSVKRPGRHPWFGSAYYGCLMGVFVTARLSPVHSRSARLRRCLSGTPGTPQALEQLGQAAHYRDGVVIRAAVNRLLCGQREEPAAVERASCDRLLVDPRRCWSTADCARAVATSLGQESDGT